MNKSASITSVSVGQYCKVMARFCMHCLPHIVVLNVYVLRPSVSNRVSCDCDSPLIILHNDSWHTNLRDSKVREELLSHTASCVAIVRATYSASEVDKAILSAASC